MKRWLAWILIFVCLLSGCSSQPGGMDPTQTTEPTKPRQTAPAHSILWPDSAAEKATDGAVKTYAPDEGSITGLIFLGGDPLLLTARDNVTVLTRFESGTGIVKADKQCNGTLYSGLGLAVANGERFACYDPEENAVRIMDASFKELDKIKLQQTPTDDPLISRDLTTAYYAVDSEIRALDLQTGIARLVCQMDTQYIYLDTLLFNDSVLCCIVAEENGSRAAFLNTENGVTLDADPGLLKIQSMEDRFLVSRLDGATTEILTGQRGDIINSFAPEGGKKGLTLLAQGILEREYTQSGATFNLYSLEDGKRIAQMQLEGVRNVSEVVADPNGRYIWIMTRDPDNQQDVLYRWEYGISPGADHKIRIGTRFTAKNPDADGIARCEQKAREIGEKYGVEIRLGNSVKRSADHVFTDEYQVEAFEKALLDLEKALDKFPEGFFKTAAKVTNDRILHIGLIREYKANTLNAEIKNDGLQYWVDGNAYIALCVGDGVEQNFYHMLSHALDTYVYSYSIYYDFWADCNPDGFAYDESYDLYHTHEDSPYLDEENRAFINAFSMTYAHEDRATVLEYAMMEGNAHYFESPVMQAKLRQLCLGLREAFGWKKYQGTFIWEQYLKESLAYVEE